MDSLKPLCYNERIGKMFFAIVSKTSTIPPIGRLLDVEWEIVIEWGGTVSCENGGSGMEGTGMDLTDSLWLLKQIYQNKNSYYDKEKNLHLYRIPAQISDDELKKLKEVNRVPNQMLFPKHDEIWRELYSLSDAWTLSEAADAFLSGFWSAPFLWQCALVAKVMALVMPLHAHTPYAGSTDTCTICGFRDRAIDTTLFWYRRMTCGTPLDGEPVGYVLALKEMEKLGERPVPTEYDIWTFRAILTVIRSMPPKTRYSKTRDALCRARLLPTANKWVYGSLLEALALIGVLDTGEYPGMATEFTTYSKRDERPNVRVEVQAPLAWWDSSVGINEATLKMLFPTLDCSPVSLADRPAAVPPLPQTITGKLEKKRLPRQSIPKSPDAGVGFAEAGDVYAVRIRDDVWVTVYCHRIEGIYAVVEYLDGIFSEMPEKSQINQTARPRPNGRWQTKTSRIDHTAGIRRIARKMPIPVSDLPEPERSSFSKAADLKHLARWCFRELP